MPRTTLIPDLRACFDLLAAERVPAHIVGHSVVVTRISLVLGAALGAAGQPQDLELLAAAGLLHDIAKFATLETGEDHARVGARLLARLGYGLVADVVGQHVRLAAAADCTEAVSETEIVFYADKRVRHEEIVSLEQRFVDLRARYGRNEGAVSLINEMAVQTRVLEEKIFRCLSWSPGRLAQEVEKLPRESGEAASRDRELLAAWAAHAPGRPARPGF